MTTCSKCGGKLFEVGIDKTGPGDETWGHALGCPDSIVCVHERDARKED